MAIGFGAGYGSFSSSGELIEIFYPEVFVGEEASKRATNEAPNTVVNDKSVVCVSNLEEKPRDIADAFLRLHLLSHRKVTPNSINLQGLFALLHNLAWTSKGPITLEDLPEARKAARLAGEQLRVFSVDKFPQMADYVVPSGVRIADTSRVRLGAYIGAGTTVMHEGFINFNAGTLGKGMIEGRISAGVVVGDGSDLGGGCSTMGTLSGGNDVVISIGENCLVGANAGVGIPLGNNCTIEAGLYVTASSKVEVLDDKGSVSGVVKAKDLASKENLLFRRNSISGAMQCKTNKTAIELNEELHAHN